MDIETWRWELGESLTIIWHCSIPMSCHVVHLSGVDQGQRHCECGRGGVLQGQQRHHQCGQCRGRSFQHEVCVKIERKDKTNSRRLLAQTTLRNILGTKDLYEILSNRESISGSMQVWYRTFYKGVIIQSYLILSSVKVVLDEATVSWGIKVERVEMYDE